MKRIKSVHLEELEDPRIPCDYYGLSRDRYGASGVKERIACNQIPGYNSWDGFLTLTP